MLAAAILLGVIVVCQLIALSLITTMQADVYERAEIRHASQVADLLQRIQAPEAAIVQHQILSSEAPDRPAPSFEDDEEYWVSKETLAARLANES